MLYGVFAFLSTLAVYNGQRLFKAEQKTRTPWLTWVKRNEKVLFLLVVFASIGAVMVLLLIQNLGLYSLLILGISGLISVFYVIKIAGRNMREIPHIKIHLIAVSWVAVLIAFPSLNEGQITNLWLTSLGYYCYVVGVTIPFDIRDLKYDDALQKTIPQVIGVKGAKGLSIVLLIAFTLLMVYTDLRMMTNPLFYGAVIVQLCLVLFMNEQRSDVYCAGGIDGAIALLGMSYFYPI